jgi:hypothetical protein
VRGKSALRLFSARPLPAMKPSSIVLAELVVFAVVMWLRRRSCGSLAYLRSRAYGNCQPLPGWLSSAGKTLLFDQQHGCSLRIHSLAPWTEPMQRQDAKGWLEAATECSAGDWSKIDAGVCASPDNPTLFGLGEILLA